MSSKPWCYTFLYSFIGSSVGFFSAVLPAPAPRVPFCCCSVFHSHESLIIVLGSHTLSSLIKQCNEIWVDRALVDKSQPLLSIVNIRAALSLKWTSHSVHCETSHTITYNAFKIFGIIMPRKSNLSKQEMDLDLFMTSSLGKQIFNPWLRITEMSEMQYSGCCHICKGNNLVKT